MATKARSFTPPVRVHIEDGTVDGKSVVVVQVHECDRSAKPCRVTATGKAYLRSYDGDFAMSELEEQAFLISRKPPLFDRARVEDATPADLDADLIREFVRTVRDRDPRGLGRFTEDTELLRRAGIVDAEDNPTVAGILALGWHPQQWFPRFVIQASADPEPGDPAGSRARNQTTITGPIPRMLDDAMNWARRTFGTTIVTDSDGTVHDRPEYPLVAFRELISNALVHRDLDHWSMGMAVEVRLRRDRLVITNPGGLYGITIERLGRDAVTSARNARLVAICQHVRSTESGARVIEALASGLPTVAEALEAVDLPAARYVDSGIRFTAVLYHAARKPIRPLKLHSTEQRVYDALQTTGPQTVADLETVLALARPTIRKALRGLRAAGLIELDGGRGRATTYWRSEP